VIEINSLSQILYARLNLFKGISSHLVSQDSKPSPPLADSPVEGNSNGEKAPAASPSTRNLDHYYEMLLGLCERLFENEIEQHLFEDQIRGVFGLKVL